MKKKYRKTRERFVNHINFNRTGVVLIIVIGCIVFTMIIFASLVSRVRRESRLTMRSSYNEQLYQLASAIGRISARKIASDFKARNRELKEVDKIFKTLFDPSAKPLKKEPYDSIKKLDVIQELLARYKHQQGDLSFDVNFSIDLGSNFPPEFIGLEPSSYERSGFIDVEVDVSYAGYRRKFLVKKQFFLTHLLAPPFYKFTLFAHKGADLSQLEANRITMISDMGKVSDTVPPLVLFNRRLSSAAPNQQDLDFLNPAVFSVKPDTFSQNGWVYLGGNGQSPGGLLFLNISPGAENQVSQNYFGEVFHLYFTDESNGWMENVDWTQWLNEENTLPPNFSDRLKVCVINYGYFSTMPTLQFNNQFLFKSAISRYLASPMFSSEQITTGSTLHLYGTPSLCTPTLVFGKVKRRYYQTSSFLFPEKTKVYPIRYIGNKPDWDDFWTRELKLWLTSPSRFGNSDPAFIQELERLFQTGLTHPVYLKGGEINFSGGRKEIGSLYPKIIDHEPYITGLLNIVKRDPTGTWSQAFTGNPYISDSPESLCTDNYNFSQKDPFLRYTGGIASIKPPKKYLYQKTSYFIDDGTTTKPVKLGACAFFLDKFVSKIDHKSLYLNQIIGFKNDLIVDKNLDVVKGGIIYSEGTITIKSIINNPYLTPGSGAPIDPDAFGYVTFIAKKGIILEPPVTNCHINSNPQFHQSRMAEFHGFLVCINGSSGEVKTNAPVHIVGGVAVDRIDSLAKNGGVIEWGFSPAELSTVNGDPVKIEGFYGIALGPRDIEIVVND